MASIWSKSKSKSPQVSRTILSIQADLNNAVIWMVPTCPLILKSTCPFTNLLGIVPNGITIMGIKVTFMFHSFFSSLLRSTYLSLFSLYFNFTHWSARTAKSTIWKILFSLFTIIRSGRLVEIQWSVSISNIPEKFIRFILQDGFQPVLIPFVRRVKV